jgi:hypothetical protein
VPPLELAKQAALHLRREDGEVVATFREPFDLLAETTAIAARSAVSEIPNLTSNMCRAPEPAFRRVLEGIRELRLAAQI